MLFAGSGSFQFLDAVMGALERFVLDQHRLHQGVDRVGRAKQALRNGGGGIGIARRGVDLAEPVEKVVNHLAFLRCHGRLPWVSRGLAPGRCRDGLCRK